MRIISYMEEFWERGFIHRLLSSMQKQRENIAKYMGLTNETVIGKSKEFSL